MGPPSSPLLWKAFGTVAYAFTPSSSLDGERALGENLCGFWPTGLERDSRGRDFEVFCALEGNLSFYMEAENTGCFQKKMPFIVFNASLALRTVCSLKSKNCASLSKYEFKLLILP